MYTVDMRHTYEYAIFCKECLLLRPVNTATNDIVGSEGRSKMLADSTAGEAVSIVAVITIRIGFPACAYDVTMSMNVYIARSHVPGKRVKATLSLEKPNPIKPNCPLLTIVTSK